MLDYFLLWCFCFKNLELDFFLSTLFAIFTSWGLKLWVKSLHPKQYVAPSSFPNFIGFIFDCVFFLFCNLVKYFLTTYTLWFGNWSFNFFTLSSSSFIVFLFYFIVFSFSFIVFSFSFIMFSFSFIFSFLNSLINICILIAS